MKNSKKGVMGMSISTVVMLVIAVVFIGAAIMFIRNFFLGMGEIEVGPPKITNPTANKPIDLIPSSITVKTGSQASATVGIYNKQPNTININLGFGSCSSTAVNAEEVCEGNVKPIINALAWDIEVGDAREFKTQIIAKCETSTGRKNLPAGTYTCSLVAYECENPDSETAQESCAEFVDSNSIVEAEQIILEIHT